MAKGKSVCDRLSIRKEKLEGSVINLIKETLPFSKPAVRFEEMILEYLEKRLENNGELELIFKRLKENEQKMQNLLNVVEKGIELETVLGRLKELEKTKLNLEEEKARAERLSAKKIDVRNASRSATDFLLSFERKFHMAPIQEKKEMIRQVVIGIRINPETRVATCAMTKIPMVNQTLTALVNPSEFMKIEHPVGAHCSGGRT